MELLALRLRGEAGELLARCCCLVALDCRLSPPALALTPPVAPAFLPRASCFSILSMARNMASNLRSSRDLGLSFLFAGVDVGVLAADALESSSLPSCTELLLLVGVVAFAGVFRFAGVGVACTLLLLLPLLLLLLLLLVQLLLVLMLIVGTVASLIGDFVGDTMG